MRAILAIVATLAVTSIAAGCGQTASGPAGDAPAVATSMPDAGTTAGAPTGPPAIVLVSAAGTQRATPGSSCVSSESGGTGVSGCLDTALPVPDEVTVVHPGDRVTIRLVGVHAVRAEGCHARDRSCIGEADVTPAGCSGPPLGRAAFEAGASETTLTVSLSPGTYDVRVYAAFAGEDGRSGDVSGALGLRVDPGAARAILPAEKPRSDCR